MLSSVILSNLCFRDYTLFFRDSKSRYNSGSLRPPFSNCNQTRDHRSHYSSIRYRVNDQRPIRICKSPLSTISSLSSKKSIWSRINYYFFLHPRYPINNHPEITQLLKTRNSSFPARKALENLYQLEYYHLIKYYGTGMVSVLTLEEMLSEGWFIYAQESMICFSLIFWSIWRVIYHARAMQKIESVSKELRNKINDSQKQIIDPEESIDQPSDSSVPPFSKE